MPNDNGTGDVTVSEWNVCYNGNDNMIVISCVLNSSGSDISGAGLMLNNGEGATLVSSYVEFSNSESVTLALNVPPGDLNVGDTVYGVASGEASGKHFFFEDKLTIAHC